MPSPDDGHVARVLEYLRATVAATTEDQIHITEVPAPPFHEGARAAYMKKLLSAAGLRVDSDAVQGVASTLASVNSDRVVEDVEVPHVDAKSQGRSIKLHVGILSSGLRHEATRPQI